MKSTFDSRNLINEVNKFIM